MAFYSIYRITTGTSNTTYSVSDFKLPYPVIYNNVKYIDIPYLKYQRGRSSSNRGVISMRAWMDSEGTITKTILSGGVSKGFIRIISSDMSEADYISAIDSTVIPAGRYRFRSTAGGYPRELDESTVSLDYTTYNNRPILGIFFYAGEYSWSRPYKDSKTTGNNFGAYFTYSNYFSEPTDVIANFTEGDGSIALKSEYVNMIWDVGGDETVPTAFANWFSSVTNLITVENTITIRSYEGASNITDLDVYDVINSVQLQSVGDTRVLTMTAENGEIYTASWSSPIVPGDTFLGLAYQPDATVPDIPANATQSVEWDSDVTLYELYTDLYENVYTVRSADGLKELTSITKAPGMSSALITYVGDTKSMRLTGVNGVSYTASWSSRAPTYKVFQGLAYKENAREPDIPAGTETPVAWDSSLTLYEVYVTYRPPATPFDINLYRSTAEPNRVDKTDYLSSYGTLSGTLRNECSIIRPSITFKYDGVPLFNYVYIAPFKRWYFVTAMTSVSNDIWRMDLNCDVLHSFKDEIRALWAIIARQEYEYSLMVNDPEIVASSERTFTVIPSSISPIDQSTVLNSYVLTVVGRGGS